MEVWVPDLSGATYEWWRELGGFRKSRADSENVGLVHPAFRGYADYMQTPEFAAALQQLVERSSERRTAIMCSESLWWRCHRRLVADAATLVHGVEVRHLMHDGRVQPHRVTSGARLTSDGSLRYDVVEAEGQ